MIRLEMPSTATSNPASGSRVAELEKGYWSGGPFEHQGIRGDCREWRRRMFARYAAARAGLEVELNSDAHNARVEHVGWELIIRKRTERRAGNGAVEIQLVDNRCAVRDVK